MTPFKVLRKFVQEQQQLQHAASKGQFNILHNKSFWLWDEEEHTRQYNKTGGQCCFNHIVGLPQNQSQSF